MADKKKTLSEATNEELVAEVVRRIASFPDKSGRAILKQQKDQAQAFAVSLDSMFALLEPHAADG